MMSRPPNFSTAAPTKRSAKPGSETLPLTAIASPPAALISATTASPGAASRSLTTTLAPSLASFSAMARPMPRPDPVMSETFPLSFDIWYPRSERDDGFAGELDLAVLVFGRQREPGPLFALVLDQLGHVTLAGQTCTKLGDRCKSCRKRTNTVRRNRIGQRLSEIAHHQHAVREHIRETRVLGEIDVDMHRIVVARCAAIKRQRMTCDRRKRLVNDAFANRRMADCRYAHAFP